MLGIKVERTVRAHSQAPLSWPLGRQWRTTGKLSYRRDLPGGRNNPGTASVSIRGKAIGGLVQDSGSTEGGDGMTGHARFFLRHVNHCFAAESESSNLARHNAMIHGDRSKSI